MISENDLLCPKCGGSLKHYDSVRRVVRSRNCESRTVSIQRKQCVNCKSIHRELPDFIFPYKQYEVDIIIGVVEGFITCETIGYEDYPCEMTMLRWMLANNTYDPKLYLYDIWSPLFC